MHASVAGAHISHHHQAHHHAMLMSRARIGPGRQPPWDLIERRRSGVLRYARARGTMALPVCYATWDHRVVVRLPEYNDACHFIDRADVALDVDGSTVGRVRTARVTGLGLLVPRESLPVETDEALNQWPADIATRSAVIVPETVQWLQVIDDLRYPPLPDAPNRLPETFSE